MCRTLEMIQIKEIIYQKKLMLFNCLFSISLEMKQRQRPIYDSIWSWKENSYSFLILYILIALLSQVFHTAYKKGIKMKSTLKFAFNYVRFLSETLTSFNDVVKGTLRPTVKEYRNFSLALRGWKTKNYSPLYYKLLFTSIYF